ncbi:hypothetical protein C8Q78DRAFT_57819 [Trametes maxima]|nr:hypothetical protein C8Q78DRAFT_57819 [Trametes maxima]
MAPRAAYVVEGLNILLDKLSSIPIALFEAKNVRETHAEHYDDNREVVLEKTGYTRTGFKNISYIISFRQFSERISKLTVYVQDPSTDSSVNRQAVVAAINRLLTMEDTVLSHTQSAEPFAQQCREHWFSRQTPGQFSELAITGWWPGDSGLGRLCVYVLTQLYRAASVQCGNQYCARLMQCAVCECIQTNRSRFMHYDCQAVPRTVQVAVPFSKSLRNDRIMKAILPKMPLDWLHTINH